jgi:hypothetical protein
MKKYTVIIVSENDTKRDLIDFDTFTEAEDFCNQYDWLFPDENNFHWEMFIRYNRPDMKFTLTVPADWNFTPSALMLKFTRLNEYYGLPTPWVYTYDRYFNSVLYNQKTERSYVYDHLKMEQTKDPDTIKVTVFLKEKAL